MSTPTTPTSPLKLSRPSGVKDIASRFGGALPKRQDSSTPSSPVGLSGKKPLRRSLPGSKVTEPPPPVPALVEANKPESVTPTLPMLDTENTPSPPEVAKTDPTPSLLESHSPVEEEIDLNKTETPTSEIPSLQPIPVETILSTPDPPEEAIDSTQKSPDASPRTSVRLSKEVVLESPTLEESSPTSELEDVSLSADLPEPQAVEDLSTPEITQSSRPESIRSSVVVPKRESTPASVTPETTTEDKILQSIDLNEPEIPASVLPLDTISILPEDTISILPEDTISALPEDTTSALPEDTTSALPEDIISALPEDAVSALPEDTVPVSADLTEASIYDLLSPPPAATSFPVSEPPEPVELPTRRESLAESDFENIDESRFSTVALNIRDSTSSDQTSKGHKRNSSSASFLLARAQDSQFRQSLDGQQILQEEFNRVQETEEDKAETTAAAVDWDFWGAVMSDYQAFASANPDVLARSIEKGIPDSLRGMVWQLMSASKDPELEKKYLALLKETSVHEKAITRDLGRTFPHHAFFTDGQGIGQENLFNVLKAYSLYDPQVGYCQGLPFVVAILLLNMPDEEAFCLLVRLMESYDLRGHFLPDMPKLQLRLFQFDRLIEELLPVLHVHLLRQGVKSSMYCSHWFLTLFSYRFPHDIVFRIFDNCLASGIEAIFGFSLVLLQKNEEKLLSLKFDKLLAFLNTQVFETYQIDSGRYKADEFVQEAVAVQITPFMLDSYAHEYADLLKVRDAHATEVEALKNSNRNLLSQVQNMEASLTQLNDEHREVLNQLVMSKMKNEELESELVRYKFLYAEAMHQSEDALSSHRSSMKAFSKRGSAGTPDRSGN